MIAPAPEPRIFDGATRIAAPAPGNRGLAYGDGLFETMRAHRGALPWWDAHWARLSRGGARLAIALPDQAFVRAQAAELFADGGDGVLKLLVARGGNARGYAPVADAPPAWQLSRHPLPAAPPPEGLRLRWCDTRLAVQPALAGLKHCNRLEQVLARAEADAAGCDEALLRDVDGHAVSATSANLFALRDGRWRTPPVDRCGVAGTCRARLLEALDALEARLSVADVEGADAVFLCNAVRGILPVASLGARRWAPDDAAMADARGALARSHPAFAGAATEQGRQGNE
ncbi:MAG: aminodeoxychorismate lyase [Luteimonas sp.]